MVGSSSLQQKYSLKRVDQKLLDASCPYCWFSRHQMLKFQNKRFLEIYFDPDTLSRSSTTEQNLLEKAISKDGSLILKGTSFPTLQFSGVQSSQIENIRDTYWTTIKKFFVGLSIISQENKFD